MCSALLSGRSTPQTGADRQIPSRATMEGNGEILNKGSRKPSKPKLASRKCGEGRCGSSPKAVKTLLSFHLKFLAWSVARKTNYLLLQRKGFPHAPLSGHHLARPGWEVELESRSALSPESTSAPRPDSQWSSKY